MEQSGLHISIVLPEKLIYEGEISMVTLPGAAGSFTILPNHAPIVSSLKKGKVIYVAGGAEQSVEIQGGFVEMSNGQVSVCIY